MPAARGGRLERHAAKDQAEPADRVGIVVAKTRHRLADPRNAIFAQLGYALLMHDRAPFNAVRHFAINADDIDRARSFYERVFGWRFNAWGPPNFYQIDTGTPPYGALQGRRELVPGG